VSDESLAPPHPRRTPASRRLTAPSSARNAPRGLSAAQTAFVRSWAEGLDLGAAWRRYLAPEGPVDARQVRSELQRLLEQLRTAARGLGRPDLAVLLRRDPDAIAERGPAVPSLEAFAASQPPDFYSEAELQALHAQIHGRPDARDSARRRQRLRERLVAAVQTLERAAPARPQPTDSPLRWFDAPLAGRLLAAGLSSLAALQAWIGQRGLHWHRSLQRIGPRTAARITHWWWTHRDSLGDLPPEAGLTRQGPRSGSRTDRTLGSTAPARTPQAQWIQEDGLDAAWIARWLQNHQPSSHTWRAYRREAERWLMWARTQPAGGLSGLTAADCARYLAFLSAPPAEWTAPRGTPRWSAHWRPLEGPLGPRSLQAAQDILRALCAWLQREGLRTDNPWADLAADDAIPEREARPTAAAQPQTGPDPTDRPTLLADWGWVEAWIAQLTEGEGAGMQRRAGLLQAVATTGRGLSAESGLLTARTETAMPPRPGADPRPHTGLPHTGAPSGHPIGDGTSWPGTARLRELLREAFLACADWVRPQDPAAARRLAQAGTCWLRRVHLHHHLAIGTPRQQIQQAQGWRHWPRGARRRQWALG
jgi:hypothetical protein